MPDREKVMYSLERCSSSVPDACRDCEYDKWPARICVQHLTKDAMELLKAQKEKDELQKEEMAGVDSAFDKIIGDMRELLEKTTPKVMTLDEVADLEEHQFVWIEINDSDDLLISAVCSGNFTPLSLAAAFGRSPSAISSHLSYLVGVKRVSQSIAGRFIGQMNGEEVNADIVGTIYKKP